MAIIANDRDNILEGSAIRITATSATITSTGGSFLKPKNTLALAPASITLTTNTTGFNGPAYTWLWANSLAPDTWTVISGATAASYTIVNSDFNTNIGIGTFVIYKCQVTQFGYINATGLYSISRTKEVNDIPSVYITRDTVTLASTFGVIDYSNSGIDICVSIGGVFIPYATSGANSFSVATVVTGITLGNASIVTTSVANDTYRFANLSSIVSNVASVAYTITARDVDGVAINITKIQGITKITEGPTGNSAKICYTKTTLTALSTTPATIQTTGTSSLPINGSWGTGTVWASAPQTLAAGETLYQSDGIFDVVSNTITWNAPYISSLKVGSLSAITVNTGDLTVSGSIKAGQTGFNSGTGYYLGSNGTFSIGNSAGNRMTWDNTSLNINGSINVGAYTGYAWPASGGTGVHISSSGLLVGNANDGKYLQVTADGQIYSPQFNIVNGAATFSGALSAASGSFGGSLNAAIGTFSGSLTASAVNAVNTINIAGNSVTVPVGATLASLVTLPNSAETTLLSIALNTNGQPIFITCQIDVYLGGNNLTWNLYVNGVITRQIVGSNIIQTVVNCYLPSPGTSTVTLTITAVTSNVANACTASANTNNIFAIGCKR